MSAPSDLPPIPPTIAQLTGPVLLGHLFNWGLFGALSVQVYIYYLAFPRDRRLAKSIVAFTYLIELLQVILSARDAFREFGSGYGNLLVLDDVGWLWFSVPVLGTIISFTGQVFYAWRVWILSEKIWLPSIIVVLASVQGVTGIYSGGFSHVIGRFSEGESFRFLSASGAEPKTNFEVQVRAYRTTCVWLGGTALCDIILAMSMVYYLNKSKTGFRATSTLLSRIIRITVETGLACATFAILDLALFLAYQENNYHLAPSIPLGKLYSNSLLVVFNSRVRIVGGRNKDDAMSANPSQTRSTYSGSVPSYVHQLSRPSVSNPHKNQPLSPIAVSISQTQDTDASGRDIEMNHFQEPSGKIFQTHSSLDKSSILA